MRPYKGLLVSLYYNGRTDRASLQESYRCTTTDALPLDTNRASPQGDVPRASHYINNVSDPSAASRNSFNTFVASKRVYDLRYG